MIEKEEREAQERAITILKESEMIAQDLILELKNALGEDTQEFESILPEGRDFEKELDVVKQRIKEDYVKRIKHLVVTIDNRARMEALKIDNLAEEQDLQMSENMQKVREEMLAKTREEIESYKKEEEKLFLEKTKKVIEEAAQEVLGQALSSTEQETMIIKALDRARHTSQGDAGGKG
jgi:hypothetical protein